MSTRFFPNYQHNLITSPFGQRKSGFHTGIDINGTNDGKTGHTDYVKAHTGGTVSFVGFDNSAGWQVHITVDSDTTMVYYHLQEGSITVKKGDKIEIGKVIGHSGKSGNVTGAHLHFGIKVKNMWIDPYPYLDKDYPVKVEDELKRVQIGSYMIKPNAVRHAKKMVSQGYATCIKKYKKGLITYYRVQVGAFKEDKYANAMLQKMKSIGYKKAYITQEPGEDVSFK